MSWRRGFYFLFTAKLSGTTWRHRLTAHFNSFYTVIEGPGRTFLTHSRLEICALQVWKSLLATAHAYGGELFKPIVRICFSASATLNARIMPGQCTQLWGVYAHKIIAHGFLEHIFEAESWGVFIARFAQLYYLIWAPNRPWGRTLSLVIVCCWIMHFSIKIKESLALGRMIPLRGRCVALLFQPAAAALYFDIPLSRSRLLCAPWWLHAAAAESGAIWRKGIARALLSSGTAGERRVSRWYISKIKMEALTCRECVYILRQTWSTSVALNKLNMAGGC